MTQLEIDAEGAKRLTKAYEDAVAQGSDTFDFEGHQFNTQYAKYVVEYLNNELAKASLGIPASALPDLEVGLHEKPVDELEPEVREELEQMLEVMKTGAKILFAGVESMADLGRCLGDICQRDNALMRDAIKSEMDRRAHFEHSVYQLATAAIAILLESSPQFNTPLLEDQISNALDRCAERVFKHGTVTYAVQRGDS